MPRPREKAVASPKSTRHLEPKKPRPAGGRRSELARLAEFDDASLVARCRRGDGIAWETIVLRYRRLVYAIPTRCGLTPEEADEVFQTTFARLFERLETIRSPHLLRAWLVTTAKRLSLDNAQRRRPLDDSETILGGVPDPAAPADEEIEQLQNQNLVRQAFEQLPERCRALLGLLYYAADEPSYEAISRRLRMPVGSIGPTRARCLEKLLRIYQEIAAEEPGRKSEPKRD